MADLSTKKDPLHLREEKPDYVEDLSGTDDPDRPSEVGTDPEAGPTEGRRKPAIHLDEEKVRAHERKGRA
ncbi:MAG TPA: hypothetical protein VK002_05470 [Rubricoccaceae bacterium]|nr:hypothetical protein [Rubricoccaceae bacterium]